MKTTRSIFETLLSLRGIYICEVYQSLYMPVLVVKLIVLPPARNICTNMSTWSDYNNRYDMHCVNPQRCNPHITLVSTWRWSSYKLTGFFVDTQQTGERHGDKPMDGDCWNRRRGALSQPFCIQSCSCSASDMLSWPIHCHCWPIYRP